MLVTKKKSTDIKVTVITDDWVVDEVSLYCREVAMTVTGYQTVIWPVFRFIESSSCDWENGGSCNHEQIKYDEI